MMARALGTLLALTLPAALRACTYVEVKYGDGKDPGAMMIGRTMELGGEFLEKHWTIDAVARGARFPFDIIPPRDFAAADKRDQAKKRQRSHFESEVGFVCTFGRLGAMGVELEVCTDGMSASGMTMSAHTHRAARYAQGTSAAAAARLHVQYLSLIPWVLGKFNSTSAVVDALRGGDIAVVGHDFLPSQLGIHFGLSDASGHSVVLEWVRGALRVHENTVGVMTNDPSFDWHLLNLNQYAALSPHEPNRARDIGLTDTEIGPVPEPTNHGYNLVGLPGDMGPPARFVRTFFLRELARYNRPVQTESDALQLVTALLNNVDVPNGAASKQSALDVGDFTQWALVKMVKERKFLFRSYANNAWRQIDLGMLASFFSTEPRRGQSHRRTMHVFDGTDGVLDVTSAMLGADAMSVQ